jgi:hypothetical protein
MPRSFGPASTIGLHHDPTCAAAERAAYWWRAALVLGALVLFLVLVWIGC